MKSLQIKLIIYLIINTVENGRRVSFRFLKVLDIMKSIMSTAIVAGYSNGFASGINTYIYGVFWDFCVDTSKFISQYCPATSQTS